MCFHACRTRANAYVPALVSCAGWPIFGYRRKSYLIISGAVGSVSWFCMAVLVNDLWFGFVCMLLSSMAMSVSNVIAEAMLVEKSRGQTQEFASQLQAFVHGAQAVGGIIAAYFGGFLLGYLADRHMFMLCCLFPMTLVLVAMMVVEERFVGDVTAIRADMKVCACMCCVCVCVCIHKYIHTY